ncbi:MAG: ABC transporter permease [Clostridiales bacterium]|nr:ABC transporter permease [Clostridiales bacterium]
MKTKGQEKQSIKRGRGYEIWGLFKRNKPAMVGLALLAFIALVAIFADVIVPEELCYTFSGAPLETPSIEHPFGTDNLGRDLFARVVHGSRVSLLIGFGATILSLAVGAFIGAACGYFGGVLDNVVMRIFDVIACIPGMLLILVLVMALGRGTENLLYALMISGVPGYARFVRATVINLTDMEYVQCAKSYGTSNFTIILRHVLPNALGPIIIMLAGSVSGTILAAASYSFMGFGVQQPAPEWGAIIAASRQFMRLAPHFAVLPGMAIVITAMSINLMGDGLRDALDPRLKD